MVTKPWHRKVVKPAPCHPERAHYAKGLCRPCYDVAWRRVHPAYKAAYRRAHYDPDIERNTQLRAKFGLSRQEYLALLAAQGGRCAICGTTEPGGRWGTGFPLDHDHVTGKTRGILCTRCNRLLGMMGDDPALLRAAAEYLERRR